ncbi:MAG: hypothetical protein AAGC60_02830 [Acidobacteriota bacterium]
MKRRPPAAALRAAVSSAALALALGVSLLSVGCQAGSQGLSLRLSVAPAADAPWLLPSDAYPSQRLYRMRYQGPEGEAGFRLTLYLESPERYRMEASDSLGRKIWSLGMLPSRQALWLDHRQELYCLVAAGNEQGFLPLTQLPLEALPRLLVGLMPVPPAAERRRADLRRDDTGALSFHDDQDRLWSGQLEAGRLAWWSVTEVAGEAPVAWWKQVDDESIFSDRRGGQQVRWSEQVRETLGRELERLEVPRAYREGVCTGR